MLNKKYVFIDMDGTILDHSNHSVPESAKIALSRARNNGHELVLTTGRPPCLFYGMDKELGFTSFIGANGRIAVHNGETLLNDVIEREDIKLLVDYCEKHKIDIAYEGRDKFALQSKYDDLYVKFCEGFHLELPEFLPDYYVDNDVYQITLFYNGDLKRFEEICPNLHFAISNEYGIDVNTIGGLKEQGIRAFMDKLDLTQEDIIAIGDGFNDIGMLTFADESVAMGNAHDSVKAVAKYVTDSVSEDGLFNAFDKLGLIE